MSNGYNGSRSPVRVINTATHAAWAAPLPQQRAWGEPAARPVAPSLAVAEAPHLACPDCGSTLRLALVHANGANGAERRLAPFPQATAESGPIPDFEESVVRYKRDLIARALEENDGVMTRAAKALGLKYTTFVAMVHRLEVATSEGEGTD